MADRAKLRFGGFSDTLALSGLAGTLWSVGPYVVLGPLWQTATGVVTALSSMYLARRVHDWFVSGEHAILSSQEIDSSKSILRVPHDHTIRDAVLLGYLTDSGEPLWLPILGETNRPENPPNDHILITGISGTGKTVAAAWLMFQQILAGGGIIFADGKIDSDNINLLWQMLRWAGREDDLVVIHPGEPFKSVFYNPILMGDADEVASRIMATVPDASGSAGADFYRKSATQALTAVVAALQRGGYAYTAADLSLLLLSPTELEKLPNRPGIRGTEEGRVVSLFINRFRVPSKSGGTMIDVNKVKDLFGGIGGRLGLIGSGKFGQVINTTTPDVTVYDCIMQNKIAYLPLPTMGKEEIASDFAKLFVGDYRSALSWIQALPKRMRPNPSTLVFLDEPGSYLSDKWDRLFEQARSARQRLVLSPQTKANLDDVKDTLFSKVAGNCATKLMFKTGDQDTAEWAADFIGTEIKALRTLSQSSSDSSSQSMMEMVGDRSASGGAGTAEGEREQEMYQLNPEAFKKLGKGECIVHWQGDQVFHTLVPMLEFTDDFVKWAGEPKIHGQVSPRRPKPYRQDFGLYARLDEIVAADKAYIEAQNKAPPKKKAGD